MTPRRRALIGAAFLAAAAAVPLLPRRAATNAPAGRYVVSSGTVLDTKTGLTWQQVPGPSGQTWAAAKTYCQTAAGLPGTGWRLPTIKELATLIDFSRTSGPYIDPVAFPGVAPTVTDNSMAYWSATVAVPNAVAGRPTTIWSVYFSTSQENYANEPNVGMFVRCVR